MVTPWFMKEMQGIIHRLEEQHSVVMSGMCGSRLAKMRADSVVGTLKDQRQGIRSGVGEGRGEDVLQKLLAEIQSMRTSMQAMSMTRMAEIQSMKTSMDAMSMSISDLRREVRKVSNRANLGEC